MNQNHIISTACIAPGVMVIIGVHGTFNVRSQAFDLSAWVEAYGEGTATVHVQRPGETLESGSPLIYEPNDVTTEGNTLIWTFDEVDSGIPGYGACSVIYMVNGEKKAETPPIRTYIAQSLEGGAGVSPTPITDNYDDLANKPQINGHTLAGNQTGAQLGLVDATRGDEMQTAIENNAASLAAHVADTSNPHDVTKAQVGLGNVDNTSDADKPISTAQQAALDTLCARVTTNAAHLASHVADTSNPHNVTKAQVGLGNVDNTSDADKPISTAQQAALDTLGARVTTNAQGIAANSSAISDNTSAIATNTGKIQTNADAISGITAKIPTQASAANQLADKEFVNDAINSSTAYFRGSFVSHAALMAVAWQSTDPTAENYVTNNDYAYVEDDETHADEAWRYIYVLEDGGSDNGWQPQFRVNESPLTAQQIAAIDSGITAALVQQIGTNTQGLAAHVANKQNPHDVTKAQVGLGNVDNTSDADKPVSTAQQTALDALGGRVTANAAAISENAQNLATHAANGDIHTTAAEKAAWDAKADEADIPGASDAAPAMDGTASAGVSAAYSRGDHVHPTDTSRAAASALAAHIADKANPHEVTKAQVGLGSVDNTSDADKPISTAQAVVNAGNQAQINAFLTPKTIGPTALASFSDGVDGAILGKCVVNIEPVQSGSGDPSPTNIRTISGWTGAKVNVTGKNLWGGLRFAQDLEGAVGYSLDTTNKTVTYERSKSPFKIGGFKENTVYTLILTYTAEELNTSLNILYTDGTLDFVELDKSSEKRKNIHVTMPNKTVYGFRIAWYRTGMVTAYYEECGLFEGIVSQDDFVPYVGTTHNISFPSEAGTVYGGTLDVGTGVLTVDRKIYNLGDLTYINDGSGGTIYCARLSDQEYLSLKYGIGYMCSCYKPVVEYQELLDNDYSIQKIHAGFGRGIYINDKRYTNPADLKAALTNQIMLFELVTPQTYQLTPTQVRTLLGQNNIYADCGAVTVQYRGDVPNLYENVAVITEQKKKFYCPPLYQYDGEDLTVKFASEIAQYSDVGAWLKARLAAKDISGIFVKDFFKFTTSNNVTFTARVADINHDLGYGDTEVTKYHIDFICDEAWLDGHVWNKINYNNGLATEPSPWLCSDLYHFLNSLSGNVPNGTGADPATVAVDYTSTGVLDKFPAWLRDAIVERRSLEPTRYTAGALLTDDNSWAWKNIGKLWVPSEIEYYGFIAWGTRNGYSIGEGHMYPLMRDSKMRIKYKLDGSRCSLWLRRARSGYSTSATGCINSGNADYYGCMNTSVTPPVCFRIIAN